MAGAGEYVCYEGTGANGCGVVVGTRRFVAARAVSRQVTPDGSVWKSSLFEGRVPSVLVRACRDPAMVFLRTCE
jgi:hypothetical protein